MKRDTLLTKSIRDLTDEAIRESLAEISAEFERRFGPALEASSRQEERLREALERQMEQQDVTLPSSVARERGLVWLEGWFDLAAALEPPHAKDAADD